SGDRGHLADVRGDVLGVLARVEPRGHRPRSIRVLDPVADEPLNRGALDAVGAVLPERIVEVRPDAAGRSGMGEGVTGAALGYEQLLAMRVVRDRMLDSASAESKE